MHYKVLIYPIAEFAGEAEEIGRHVSGRGAVDASFAVSMLSSQVVLGKHCIQMIERYQASHRTAVGSIIDSFWDREC